MHFWPFNSQQSPSNGETQSFRCATRHGRRTASFYVVTFYLFVAAVPANAQQQHARAIYNGASLQVADDNYTYAKYSRWQVCLYHSGVRIPHYAAGLQYSRWGLMEGGSSESVVKQLRDAQRLKKCI
jgi:hypothetical protein